MLECTGNEQFVLPLMISLFSARVVGSLFNSDLYHIHIHMKKGIHFLDAELRSISGQHNLYAGHIMSRDVVFVHPIERVGVLYDILAGTNHSLYPVIDTEDRDVLYGTINRSALIMLLQARAYGVPKSEETSSPIVQTHHIQLDPFHENYVPLVPYTVLEREFVHPKIEDVRLIDADRDLLVDLRSYCNHAPHTIQERTSANVRLHVLSVCLTIKIDNSDLFHIFISLF